MNNKYSEYEILVKSILEELVKEFNTDDIKVFYNNKYTGQSKHKHQIDVSVEMKFAGVNILILFECKNHNRKLGVKYILELASRIQDIGAHKGVLVSSKGFQKGTEKIAISKGIALVKVCDLGWIPEIGDPFSFQPLCENMKSYLEWFLSKINNANYKYPEELNRYLYMFIKTAGYHKAAPFLELIQNPVYDEKFRFHGFIISFKDSSFSLTIPELIWFIFFEHLLINKLDIEKIINLPKDYYPWKEMYNSLEDI